MYNMEHYMFVIFFCTFVAYYLVSRNTLDYTDNAEFWIKGYDTDDFRPQIEHLWEQIRPLYLQIHAYMRRKLWEQYGGSVISRKGPIPAHLLGKSVFLLKTTCRNLDDPVILCLIVRC